MNRRIVDVCQAGNIEAFNALLEDDPSILNYIDEIPLTRTPLHLAILAQNYEFAKIIASLKPSYITKIDRFGHCPIHLAAKNGHVDIVRSLMHMQESQGERFVRGKDDVTPLHIAVISGKIDVVKYLVDGYPECISDMTVQNETALHLAVKHKQVQVFCYLVEWLKLAAPSSKMSLTKAVHAPFGDGEQATVELGGSDNMVNWKDMDGNTILHLATMTNQYQMIEALLSSSSVSNSIIQVDVKSILARSKYNFRHGGAIAPCKMNSSSFPNMNMQNNPIVNDEQNTSNLVSKIDIIFAIIMAIICLSTTKTNINFYYPLVIFNMVGFLLSFYTLLVAWVHSAQKKAPVIILMFVFIGYVYVMFSSVQNKDLAFLGGVFLAMLGAGIAIGQLKIRWLFYRKQCAEGMKTPHRYQHSEP